MNRIRDEPSVRVGRQAGYRTLNLNKNGGALDKKYFEYGGYHFYPLRRFEGNDGDFMSRVCKLHDDRELGMTATDEPWRKYAYDYEAFYEAAGGKGYDIFICEETGRQYVPCGHGLQEYRSAPCKSKNHRGIR